MAGGRPPSIPNHLQDELVVLYQQEDYTIERLKEHLAREHSIHCDIRTIRRKLNSWGSYKRTVAVITDELIDRVLILFYDTGLEDEEMLTVLQAEFQGKLDITKDILIRLRFRLGLRKRIGRGKEAREEAVGGRLFEYFTQIRIRKDDSSIGIYICTDLVPPL